MPHTELAADVTDRLHRLGHPGALDGTPAQIFIDWGGWGGVAHTTSTCDVLGGAESAPRTVTFTQLTGDLDVDWCNGCPGHELWGRFDTALPAVMGTLVNLAYSTALAGTAPAVNLLHAADIIRRLRGSIAELTGTSSGNPGVQAVADELITEAASHVTTTEAFLHNADAKERTLDGIRRAFGADPVLDSDTVLLSLEPSDGDHINTIHVLVAQFEVGRTEGRAPVLVVPRYVADFVAVRYPSLLRYPPAAVGDADDETISAAVALWDPDVDTPMRYLRACLDVASAVTS